MIQVLKDINKLYESGLTDGAATLGLKTISESGLLSMTPLRKPRKKISVMIVGKQSSNFTASNTTGASY